MEDTLKQLLRETSTGKSKHAAINKACEDALELLGDKAVTSAAQPHQLRFVVHYT